MAMPTVPPEIGLGNQSFLGGSAATIEEFAGRNGMDAGRAPSRGHKLATLRILAEPKAPVKPAIGWMSRMGRNGPGRGAASALSRWTRRRVGARPVASR